MAECPNCRSTLPDPAPGLCPVCGFALAPAAPDVAPPPLPPDLALGDGHGVPPGADERPGARIPWENRQQVGWPTALVETTRLVLTRPAEFFRSMPASSGFGAPILYALVVGWLGLVVASFYSALFRSLIGPSAFLGERPELAQMLSFMESWGGFAVQVVFGGAFVVVGVFLNAGIFHLVLLLLGGARREFETTIRVVAYAQASCGLFLVPFCGQLIGGVWALVLYVIGFAEAHQIGYGKALLAVLIPIAVLCCCCTAFFVTLFMGVASQLR